MRKNLVLLLAGVILSSLMTGGCANKDVVKSEESLVPKVETKSEYSKPVMKPDTDIVPASGDSKATVKSAVSPFETVYFDFDKADLRKDARDVITKNGDIIKSKTAVKVQIEGHCDERGSAEYNLALGERRAKSVLKYLTTLGIKEDRLSVISYGKEKPAVKGSDEAAWSKNRRAEFAVAK